MTKQELINEVQIQVDRFHGLYHTTADCNERYAYSRAYNAMVVIREKIEQLPDPQPQPPQEPCEVCEILYEGYSIGNRKKRIYFKHCPECGRKLREETK